MSPDAGSSGPLRGGVARFRGSLLARNASWAFVGDIGQLVLTLGTFVLLARELGPVQFGYFGAATALAAFVGSFAYVGAHRVIVMKLATGAHLPEELARRTTLLTIMSVLATLVLTALQPLLLPEISTRAYVLLVGNQILLFGLTELGVALAQAMRRLEVGAAIRGVVGVIRLLFLGMFVLFGDGTLEEWAVLAALAGVLSVLAVMLMVQRMWGVRPGRGRPSFGDVREGVPFAITTGAAGMLEAIDRPMLVRYGFSADAGFYTAGFRLATMGLLPVEALIRASDADFFQKGARGAHHVVQLFRRLVLPAAGLAIASGIGLLVVAPLVPLLVGSEYDETVNVVRWLAVLPLIRAFQLFPSNAIIASGRAMTVAGMLFGAAAVNICVNLVLIPEHSWRGALVATYVAEVLYAIALWVVATHLGRRDAERAQVDAALTNATRP
jgi:O-antigen/teichoic acid export membrane protein